MQAKMRPPLRGFLVLVVLLFALFSPSLAVERSGLAVVLAAPPRQTEINVVDMVDVMNRWHLGAFRGYKFNTWISLGDVTRFNDRIADGDVQVYLDPAHLQSLGAAAAYEDCAGIGCSKYMNDIVLADQPANVDPKTMWHESMHAIFDAHDSELLVPDDEIYTWYMENTVDVLNQVLTRYEDEWNKGDQCDQQLLDQLWGMFERRMEEAKAGQGFYGPITSDAQLQQLRQLTGFHADVATIKANYAAAGMDKCTPLTPTVEPNRALTKSVILVIDASGSMDGTKIQEAKAAAKNLLQSMGVGQEVGLLVFYDCGAITWHPFSTDFASFLPIVDAIYASGGTPLGASIRTAGGHMSAEASGREGVIIVLTDGGESCGDNPVDAASSVYQMTLPRKISYAPMSLPVAYADGGDILVSVIGFDIGDATVEEQLRAIAEAGGGQYFAASDVDELSTALKQAAGARGISTLLLIGGGVAACVLPLLLLLVVVILLSGRRRRVPAPVPVGYGPAPQPRYGPPPQPGYPPPVQGVHTQPVQGYPQQPQYAPPRPPYQATAGAQVPGTVVASAELVLVGGRAQPPGLSLSAPVVRIGRSQRGNHIVIQDPMVSSAHAEICAQGGGHYIQDLRSTNGTFVNGVRVVQPRPLCDGDHIALGGTEWVYRHSGGTMMMPGIGG
jgi:Mg-chelatase subunit ChlD